MEKSLYHSVQFYGRILPFTAKFAKAATASMRTGSCGTLARRTSLGIPPLGKGNQ